MIGTSSKPNSVKKHRFYIDVTFNKPISLPDAAKGVQLKIDCLDYDADPIWAYNNSAYINKIKIIRIRNQAHGSCQLKR